MNIRKPINYSVMYAELDEILSKNLPQMEEIHAIGKAICKRPEKGAAVMAAEYLQANYPERSGFSPRNVRRMRDFYRTYENAPAGSEHRLDAERGHHGSRPDPRRAKVVSGAGKNPVLDKKYAAKSDL